MEYNLPSVYAPFIRALAAKPGILHLMVDKYGCRVVQMCLEKLVTYCSNTNVCDKDKR
jgi:Pumilio-family RNA binding repeat